MKHTYASSWRLCIGAMSNKVRTATEAGSPGGEGQSMSRLCEKIFGEPCGYLSAPLYKAPAAEGQAREAVSYLCRALLSNLRDWKKFYKASFTNFYVYTPSI